MTPTGLQARTIASQIRRRRWASSGAQPLNPGRPAPSGRHSTGGGGPSPRLRGTAAQGRARWEVRPHPRPRAAAACRRAAAGRGRPRGAACGADRLEPGLAQTQGSREGAAGEPETLEQAVTGGQGQGQGGADGGADGAHRAIDGLVQLDELLGEGQAGVARLFRRAGLGLGMAIALVKALGLADVLDLSYLEADLVRPPPRPPAPPPPPPAAPRRRPGAAAGLGAGRGRALSGAAAAGRPWRAGRGGAGPEPPPPAPGHATAGARAVVVGAVAKQGRGPGPGGAAQAAPTSAPIRRSVVRAAPARPGAAPAPTLLAPQRWR